jgi:hypothetical protein
MRKSPAEDRRYSMLPVNHIVPGVLVEILRKAPLTPEKVAFAWRTSVGPAMNKVTAVELRGRVLHVRAKDPSWQREVERSLGIVRSRMEALLGRHVVGDIRVRVD